MKEAGYAGGPQRVFTGPGSLILKSLRIEPSLDTMRGLFLSTYLPSMGGMIRASGCLVGKEGMMGRLTATVLVMAWAVIVLLASGGGAAAGQPSGVDLNPDGSSYISWMFDLPQSANEWQNTCSFGCGGHLRDDYYADDWALPASEGLTGEQRTSGQLVYAGISGIAIVKPNHGAYGNDVIIYDAESRFALRNAHLSEIQVDDGQVVAAGTPIGKVGNSGNVTASHLHIVLYKNVTDASTRPVDWTTLQSPSGPTSFAAPFLYNVRVVPESSP